MSIKKWQELAQRKEEVEKQRLTILNAFKARKVQDEMGGLAAEKLFRPITRRMEKKQIQLQTPDYDVDDEIRNWDEFPFEEDEDEEKDPDYSLFEEDIPKDFLDSDDEVFPGEKPRRQSRLPRLPQPPEHPTPPPPPPYSSPPLRDSDSTDLVTLNRFLNANKKRPNAVIANPKSKFYNWDKEMAQDEIDRIYQKRRKSVASDLEKRKPGKFSGLTHRERRNFLGFQGKSLKEIGRTKPFDKASSSNLKKMFGTGLSSLVASGSPLRLMNRLIAGIGSINAENTSVKLRKEIQSIADILFQNGILSKEQRKKILSLK